MNTRKFILGSIIGLGAIAATWTLAANTGLLFGVYVGLSFLMFLIERKDLSLYVMGIVVAIIFEPVAVSFEVWNYPVSDLVGIPLWVPLMWGLAFVSAYRFGDYWLRHRI